jgi:hypothetical protein
MNVARLLALAPLAAAADMLDIVQNTLPGRRTMRRAVGKQGEGENEEREK